MVTSYRDIVYALRRLGIDRRLPVITHASLSAFGEVQGGAQALLGALLNCFETVVMPAFTYKTMVIPEVGPEGNALRYGSGKGLNRMAEIFGSDMPADRLMGVVAEEMRKSPAASRSMHPVLSFSGIHAEHLLSSQTLQEPLAPIQHLVDTGGWVLLCGVDQTVNTSIHLGERLAGRRQFIRWALTTQGVVECPAFPGCSNGFQDVEILMRGATRRVQAGSGTLQAVPLAELISVVVRWIREDPTALLCNRSDCENCQAVRRDVPARKEFQTVLLDSIG